MELKFLGRGSAFNTKEGNTSAYYKKDNMLLLIDCGETVFKTIKENNILDGIEDVNILITHLHSDHVGSLSSLIMYCYYCKGIKPNIAIYDLAKYELSNYLLATGCIEGQIWNRLNFIDMKDVYEINIVGRIVTHDSNIVSFGFLIEDLCSNERILYSGDTNNAELLSNLKGGYIDTIYHDTCLAHYEGNVHTSLSKLCNALPKEYRDRVWCMHLDCDELIDKAKLEGFNVVKNEF